MTNAGNALLWTVLYFALSFAAIFVVWFADKIRSNLLGKR
ncbi:putative membrane protein [Bradyrhizobium sp. USDA 3397]